MDTFKVYTNDNPVKKLSSTIVLQWNQHLFSLGMAGLQYLQGMCTYS